MRKCKYCGKPELVGVGIEQVLQDYADSKISTERLSELLGVNYYILHEALRKGSQLFDEFK